ncbi:putative protein phosphatase 2C 54 [Dichanthelium oligosanthes]|uniref:protein-serine/threonine phosphatase n=1 Tax=Dichanthelium oligosanthes TaxID=888268 RepID=A0A1E5WI27_9POAL|nr:putative protein phosphatase 2C 54 [Dichanthelium oligosanthes]
MCVEEQEDAEKLGFGEDGIEEPAEFPLAQMERVCENTTSADFRQIRLSHFVPVIRSGDWSDIGGRQYMEDAHVCIPDLAKNFGFPSLDNEVVSFYGVSTAVLPTPFYFFLVRQTHCIATHANLQAVYADVLSRYGTAIEMSMDHRPCSLTEKLRVESLGGYVDDGYLNGLLGVTRALGDWHLEGMKEVGEPGGPLSAEPELKMITLTKDDEFLIIGSDGIWDVFSNQNSVDFARRRLQEHNNVELCCKEIVEEAIRRGATDNLTAVLVSFHLERPRQIKVDRPGRVARSISADGLNSLRILLGRQ